VRLLLIGWNPPRPREGFWVLDKPDGLRADLHQIFRELRLCDAPTPEAFVDDFLSRGFYFIHAIKCFSKAGFPSNAARKQIQQVCVAAHLADDLAHLQPERICLLGRLPLQALAQLCPELDAKAPLLVGNRETVRFGGRDLPVLMTCFPNGRPGAPGETLRETVLRHLRDWSALRGLYELTAARVSSEQGLVITPVTAEG
jgi:hypothetical protein